MKDHIYDIETYPNCWTLCIADTIERKVKVFEISFRKDQREQLFDHLRTLYRNRDRMVGFNNVGFDYPVLHWLLKNKTATVQQIYNKAMEIIKSEDKFGFLIKEKDVMIEQIDLYKIHHFDNKARATSLKMLEFNMRSDNIEDLPFPVGKMLTSDDIDVLIKYNKHDVMQTFKFYEYTKTQIEFREQLTRQYGKNFMNFNDTKIGKDYFITKLEESMPGCCYKKGQLQQTIREYIDIRDCIFPYIKFESPEFNAVLNWLKSQRIRETKGVFSDILEHELDDVAKYANMYVKKKKLKDKPTDDEITKLKEENPSCWIEEVLLKSGKISYYVMWRVASTLNVNYNGFRLDFGTGGIHGSVESQTIYSNRDSIVIDQDVASFYPNLAIKNRVYPEHLSEMFCDIYEYIYDMRKEYKKKGMDAEQAMLKLALNGTYGASNDKFSPLYDPKFTMSITVNGQLSLCMLIEQLAKLDGFSMVQANTDGITFVVSREDEQKADEVCKWWEDVTKLELEKNVYSRMIIRDVNNYIAEYEDGHLKNKGAYEWQNLGWHKNHSAPVISMAAEMALVHVKSIEETIRNHPNHMDFMLRTKVPRSSNLVLVKEDGTEEQLQNICRYYVSNNGGQLVKVMPPVVESKMLQYYMDDEGNEYFPKNKTEEKKFEKLNYKFMGEKEVKQPPRRIGIDTGWNVVPCNDIKKFSNDINYDYYIEQTNKLVDLCISSTDEELQEQVT